MKYSKMSGYILVPLLLLLASCTSSAKLLYAKIQQTVPENNSTNVLIDKVGHAEIVDESEYYKLVCSELTYYYYIFDENHNIVKSDGPFNKQPCITMVNDLVKITQQTGTGLGTQWGFYYHTKMDVFSRVFQCIYDQYDGMVAFCDMDKVIVRDIFDKTKFYWEISTFKKPFSKMIDPITNARFIHGGEYIEISYLTGDSYQEVFEMIKLI